MIERPSKPVLTSLRTGVTFIAVIALATVALAERAYAYVCPHSWRPYPRVGYARVGGAVVRAGQRVSMRFGEGDCKHDHPVRAAAVELTWSRDPHGPFVAAPHENVGDWARLTLPEPGAYFVHVGDERGRHLSSSHVLLARGDDEVHVHVTRTGARGPLGFVFVPEGVRASLEARSWTDEEAQALRAEGVDPASVGTTARFWVLPVLPLHGTEIVLPPGHYEVRELATGDGLEGARGHFVVHDVLRLIAELDVTDATHEVALDVPVR